MLPGVLPTQNVERKKKEKNTKRCKREMGGQKVKFVSGCGGAVAALIWEPLGASCRTLDHTRTYMSPRNP